MSISDTELEAIRQTATYRRDTWQANNPGVQVPPSEGIDTLRLVQELKAVRQRRGLNSKHALFIADRCISLN
jgi:hypothetical protein